MGDKNLSNLHCFKVFTSIELFEIFKFSPLLLYFASSTVGKVFNKQLQDPAFYGGTNRCLGNYITAIAMFICCNLLHVLCWILLCPFSFNVHYFRYTHMGICLYACMYIDPMV